MDEYIKREDALDAVLFALVGTGVQSRAIYAIRELPTADVVPKSEVERLTVELDAMRGAANSYKMHYEKARREVAREIFEEIEKLTYRYLNDADYSGGDMIYDIAELKKKRTEEKK